MIIDNSGNIGIGTTKTKSNINLLVNGSMEVTGDITGNITANSASATKIKITNNTLDTDYFLTFTQTMVNKNDLLGNNNLKYNPLNKTLTTDIFSGTLDGNAASASKIEITQIGNSFYDPPIPNFITFPGTFDQTKQPYSERITNNNELIKTVAFSIKLDNITNEQTLFSSEGLNGDGITFYYYLKIEPNKLLEYIIIGQDPAVYRNLTNTYNSYFMQIIGLML